MPPRSICSSVKNKVLTALGLVLCLFLAVMLVLNVILIVKSLTNKDEVPSIGNTSPLIVLTGSMEPDIKTGELIFVTKTDPNDIVVNEDVIAFFDPAGNGTSVVTHKVINKRMLSDGKWEFETWGIANDTPDEKWVHEDKIIGVYQFGIPFLGNIAMFMQTTVGFIVCIGTPIVALVAYDFVKRRKQDKEAQADTDALLAELAALRAEKENREKKD